MNLLVDIGNTSLKWALAGGHETGSPGRFVHRGHDLVPLLEQAWGDMAAPERILVSSVAGTVQAERLADWTVRTWRLRPQFIRASRQAAGLTCAYERPVQLGADRWAAMIAAWHSVADAVCVVDCGTAITLDLVDANGRHRGGQILAGVAMMRQALAAQTADLPLQREASPPVLLATTTADAINSGSLFAAAAAIERLVADMAADTGLRPVVVLTGGDAPVLLPLLGLDIRHDADLVLKGIAILAGEA